MPIAAAQILVLTPYHPTKRGGRARPTNFNGLRKTIPQSCALMFFSAELNIERLKNILVFYGKRMQHILMKLLRDPDKNCTVVYIRFLINNLYNAHLETAVENGTRVA